MGRPVRLHLQATGSVPTVFSRRITNYANGLRLRLKMYFVPKKRFVSQRGAVVSAYEYGP
jgi:hypothetical protein